MIDFGNTEFINDVEHFEAEMIKNALRIEKERQTKLAELFDGFPLPKETIGLIQTKGFPRIIVTNDKELCELLEPQVADLMDVFYSPILTKDKIYFIW